MGNETGEANVFDSDRHAFVSDLCGGVSQGVRRRMFLTEVSTIASGKKIRLRVPVTR
jgi:hypothetical protein